MSNLNHKGNLLLLLFVAANVENTMQAIKGRRGYAFFVLFFCMFLSLWVLMSGFEFWDYIQPMAEAEVILMLFHHSEPSCRVILGLKTGNVVSGATLKSCYIVSR